MTAIDVDVLIVGAGPTGLTLACALARHGVSFRLVEASQGPQQGSRGKGIQPRTLEVFVNLGIVDRVIANGRLAMPICSIDADGHETRSGGDPHEPTPDIPYPATLLIPEWRIEEALRNRLSELGGSVAFGQELFGFEQTAVAVSATLTDGSDERTITARWLVGCDGGRSTVRKLAGIDFLGETMEAVRMIVADVRADGIDRDCWRVWRATEGFVALCPLPSTDEFQFQASVAPGQDAELSLANMQAILSRRSRTDIRLREPGWSSLWRANVRMVDRYRAARVLLAGDAAHVHSPAGGQGMNTGIQDAHNLGWKLAAVVQGAPPALLDTYQEERLPIAAGVLALSNQLLRQTISERGIVIARDERTTQLNLGYRGSSLARDDRGEDARLRAGDRAPDAAGLVTPSGECRLFDLLRGEHFTLLSFGQPPIPPDGLHGLRLRTLHLVDSLSGPDDVIDAGGHLRQAYAPAPGTMILIRPDGYVGLIAGAGGRTAVATYLASLFTTS
jgi:2-polyprenyl-6-methoxyphenol hydroxylase-like FAD-dependent oxidoreductase